MMTISLEHLSDMDASFLTHQQEVEEVVQARVRDGQLFEAEDVISGVRFSQLIESYTRLAASESGKEPDALRPGVEKALVAGWHLASTILPRTFVEARQDLSELPLAPDHSDIESLLSWARQQPETGKLAVRIAEHIAEQGGDTSLTMPLATMVGFALFHTSSDPQATLVEVS